MFYSQIRGRLLLPTSTTSENINRRLPCIDLLCGTPDICIISKGARSHRNELSIAGLARRPGSLYNNINERLQRRASICFTVLEQVGVFRRPAYHRRRAVKRKLQSIKVICAGVTWVGLYSIDIIINKTPSCHQIFDHIDPIYLLMPERENQRRS